MTKFRISWRFRDKNNELFLFKNQGFWKILDGSKTRIKNEEDRYHNVLKSEGSGVTKLSWHEFLGF